MALQDLIGKAVRVITVTPIKIADGVSGKEFGVEMKEIEAAGIWIESTDLQVALVKESGMAEDFGKKKRLLFLPFSQVKAIIS